MKQTILQSFVKKFWFWLTSFLFILLMADVISSSNKSVAGRYESYFPQFSIELQDGGKVFVSPMRGVNKTIYCATEGHWSAQNNEVLISLDQNENCSWINDFNGRWSLSDCNDYNGTSTHCMLKGDFKLVKK